MEIKTYILDNGEEFTDMATAMAKAEEIHSCLYKRVVIIKEYAYGNGVWFSKEFAEERGYNKPL